MSNIEPIKWGLFSEGDGPTPFWIGFKNNHNDNDYNDNDNNDKNDSNNNSNRNSNNDNDDNDNRVWYGLRWFNKVWYCLIYLWLWFPILDGWQQPMYHVLTIAQSVDIA